MKKPRLIYYNDAHHFHAKRIDPPLNSHKLHWPVDEVVGTGVESLVLGLGYGEVYFHNSKIGRVVGEKKEVWENFIDWRIMRMVEDARDQLGQRNSVDRIGEINARIQRVQKEIENLTAGIRSLGPLDTLKDAMRKCQKGLAALEVEKHEVSADEMLDWTSIDEALIKMALTDLRGLLADASSAKEALQENIREIRIPKKGAALLEPRPEGLLNRVFLLVTPRGVA